MTKDQKFDFVFERRDTGEIIMFHTHSEEVARERLSEHLIPRFHPDIFGDQLSMFELVEIN